ncbi:hypothetical protein IGB42_02359 [Andreprevotia sp. IGB-42]|uniref:MOSC domain-containing protein n=1 Tax=Andreprevotia sp. IGB-42 TaxID=2497473 RepID=UPI00135A1363|nr:MOSC domain-containing protein [Andreprevotia sp. IGB-42]KAF0812964.1 hypothetical protein IGB42_02359 [Andreprevotia sp. IGB-42]
MTSPTCTLTALYRYPVKSMHGQSLVSSAVSAQGLADDRAWMVADETGRFVTGRELPRLVTLHAAPDEIGITLSAPDGSSVTVARKQFNQLLPVQVWRDAFDAWHGAADADDWLSAQLGRKLQLIYTGETQRRVKRHPEVPLSFADGHPLLLIGEASRVQLSAWVGRDMAMARFRPNLVISGTAAFAEDGWQRIRIGEVIFRISKPCERCVFTTVDPDTGEKTGDQEPIRSLVKHRKGEDGVLFGQLLLAENNGQLQTGLPVEVLA